MIFIDFSVYLPSTGTTDTHTAKNKNKTLLNYLNSGGICCPFRDVGGKIIFFRGSFSLCPRVFRTPAGAMHDGNVSSSHRWPTAGGRCICDFPGAWCLPPAADSTPGAGSVWRRGRSILQEEEASAHVSPFLHGGWGGGGRCIWITWTAGMMM